LNDTINLNIDQSIPSNNWVSKGRYHAANINMSTRN
jgi:hypothetical protein